ncbi:MAG: hypothetical protein H7A32_02195 [Deltaproteobacteria bacterium]|nr:hypothetical protein [Deltaproteobacteria bacterium]
MNSKVEASDWVAESAFPQEAESKYNIQPKGHWVDKDFFQEAQLFINQDRATLTFYVNNKVASIHFDKNKGEIYYKGQSLRHTRINPKQEVYLKKFGKYLKKQKVSEDFLRQYEWTLSHYLSYYHS